MYEIRLCKAEEVGLLKSFLKNSWSQNHIFVHNNTLLDFQHKAHDEYNFVVAHHLETNSFHGVLGIISPDFYTCRKINKNQDIWLAIWKVDKSLTKSSNLGLDMLEYVEAEFAPKSISAIGINKEVALIYRLLGFKTSQMKQWFKPNIKISKYKLIVGTLPKLAYEIENSYHNVVECGIEHENNFEIFLSNNKSKKSFKYLIERYLKHPIYKYKIFAILKPDSNPHALIVGREVKANGANAFRITELFFEKDTTLNISSGLNEIMVNNAYEYIDFIEYGFNEMSLKNCGFIESTDNYFVPHLFEPFVGARKEVSLAFKSKDPFTCTKGDSDLDRPNL